MGFLSKNNLEFLFVKITPTTTPAV